MRIISPNQDKAKRVERQLQMNPNVTKHMLDEWRITMLIVNLLLCINMTKRCDFLDNILSSYIERIENNEYSFKLLQNFQVATKNYTTSVDRSKECFKRLYAALHSKRKNFPMLSDWSKIDFNALHQGIRPIHAGSPPECNACKRRQRSDKMIDSLMHCTQCDVSYHMHESCIPAGSQLISRTELICPNHSKIKRSCHRCGKGNVWQSPQCNLLSCTNVCHKRCMSPSEKAIPYNCGSCPIQPTYNDVVYAKRLINGIEVRWPAQTSYDVKMKSGQCHVRYLASDESRVCAPHELELFELTTVERTEEFRALCENPTIRAEFDKIVHFLHQNAWTRTD